MDSTRYISKRIFQVINTFFVTVTLLLVFVAIFRKEWILEALEWVEGVIIQIGPWNYLIIIITSIIESFPFLGVVVPGMNILILIGGFFAKGSIETFALSCLIACIGACLGNATGFLLGKYAGREFLEKYGYWFGIGKTETAYLEKIMKKQGFWFIVTAKFHNVTRAFIPYIAGASKMQTSNFWTYNIVGSVLWSISILTVGVLFADNYEIILKYFSWILTGFLVIVFLYIWKFHRQKFQKYIQEKNKEVEEMVNKK